MALQPQPPTLISAAMASRRRCCCSCWWCRRIPMALACLVLVLCLTLLFLTNNGKNFWGNLSLTAASRETRSTKSEATKIRNRRKNPIQQISVLGERNSGTRWSYDHLKECFGHAIEVQNRLTRHKHWFQYRPNRTTHPKKWLPYLHDTLVIAQFRNPYDWLKAMEQVPHHAPNHLRLAAGSTVHGKNAQNDWKLFLQKPWTMERIGLDLQLNASNTSMLCQQEFYYRDIISCVVEPLPHSYYNHTIRYSEHQPFYEMRNDGSGQPFANILELRSAKIANFLSVRDYPGVADVWVMQYEYLLNEGTLHLIRRIAEWTGITPHCQAVEPQVRRPKKTRLVSPGFAKHVRLHLNWTAEAWIGYDVEWVREEQSRDW